MQDLHFLILIVAYRLRGWGGFLLGTFSRRLFWSLSIGASCVLAGAPLSLSVGSALGAFAGMMIPHGRWYQVFSFSDALHMAGIGLARALFILCWHPSWLIFPALALAMVLTPLGYWLGCRLAERNKIDSMMLAEPLVGGVFAITLALALEY